MNTIVSIQLTVLPSTLTNASRLRGTSSSKSIDFSSKGRVVLPSSPLLITAWYRPVPARDRSQSLNLVRLVSGETEGFVDVNNPEVELETLAKSRNRGYGYR